MGYELRWGFTLADIERMARLAVWWERTKAIDVSDRYEAAYFAICERLYAETDEQPGEAMLIDIGHRAVVQEVRDHFRHNGGRDDSTNPGYAFAKVWLNPPTGFPDDSICERLALPRILSALTQNEREALGAAVMHPTQGAAAAALGIGYGAFKQRLTRAKKKAKALWYEHETPPLVAWRGTCREGHDREKYGRLPPSGSWYCVKCRREYRIRRRAKGLT